MNRVYVIQSGMDLVFRGVYATRAHAEAGAERMGMRILELNEEVTEGSDGYITEEPVLGSESFCFNP
jgi:hypothetical protein